MPKLPIDHSNTIIYKLVKNDDYDNVNIYIGSTTDFIRRKNAHKTVCCNEKSKGHNDKKYQYIRDNGGWDNWNMIEIEKYPECNDGNEARAREEYRKCHFNAQLNTKRAYITVEQKKQYGIEYYKEYYEKNKDKYLEYREDNKDNILKQRKQYYETHKDKILENMKTYYNNKKNKTDSSSED